jgi:hypothetical protein
MQFTPQQLTGGAKFGSSVRIGNWSEDIELEEIKLKDYLKKKESGSLVVLEKQAKLERSLQPMGLSVPDDGVLRFGMTIMIYNHAAEGFLAGNANEKIPKTNFAIATTAGPNSNPCVRNVFTLERAQTDDGYDDDVLHYGQLFHLVLRNLLDFPVYLHSEPISPMSASKYTRRQEVVMFAKPNGSCLWKALHPDVKVRFEMDGREVPANEQCVLHHTQTGSYLCSDKVPYQTLFGREFEVCGHAALSTNKTQNLNAEKKGDITGDYALRRHGLPNIWTICTGNPEGGATQ